MWTGCLNGITKTKNHLTKRKLRFNDSSCIFFYNAQRSQYCNPNNDRMPNSRRFTQLPTSFKIQKRLPIELIPYNP